MGVLRSEWFGESLTFKDPSIRIFILGPDQENKMYPYESKTELDKVIGALKKAGMN